MKVSEAKTKVCPFIQNANVSLSKRILDWIGLDYQEPANIKCVCGDCMAWGWDIIRTLENNVVSIKDSETEGYCMRLKQ